MASGRPVYGLLKGLKILEVLAAQGQASAAELAQWTGMPRPTVYRLLDTLRSAGYVMRPLPHDKYRLSRTLHSLLSIAKTRDVLAEVALPVLEQLTREVAWPCDVTAYENGAMVIHATTHSTSPLSLERVRPGTAINIVRTATGLAYLAFCPEAQKNAIIDTVIPDEGSAASRRARIRDLEARIELTRRRGCGLRVRGSQPKTSSISMPLLTQTGIIGCITLNWIASALEADVALQRYLKPLQQAAKSISQAYDAVTQSASQDNSGTLSGPRPRMKSNR